MTDHERAQALRAMQERRNGYPLHVWTWEDPDGVVHLLNFYKGRDYVKRCDPGRFLGGHVRIPYNIKMPTCVRCICIGT